MTRKTAAATISQFFNPILNINRGRKAGKFLTPLLRMTWFKEIAARTIRLVLVQMKIVPVAAEDVFAQ